MNLRATYHLVSKNLSRPTSIRLFMYSRQYFREDGRLVWSTGQSVHPDLWNPETQRPFTSGNPVDNYIRRNKLNQSKATILKVTLKKIKRYLDRVEDGLTLYVVENQDRRPFLTTADYRAYLDEQFRGLSSPTATLTGYCETLIADMESGKRRKPKTNSRYSPGTIANYTGFLNIWKAFEKSTGKRYTLSKIDLDAYFKFVKFCENKPLNDAHGKPRADQDGTPLSGLAINTIGRHVSKWKVLMEMAKEDGIHSNEVFRNRAFVALTEDTDGTYLKQPELDRLYNADLSHNPRWEQVRDTFVAGCYTAQRVSDYTRFSSNMINELDKGHKALTFVQKKGKNVVTIPANPIVLEILNKYGGKMPYLGKNPDSVLNNHIKAICEHVGINERYVTTRGQKGRTVTRSGPKWEFIASHTARRTGITLMFLAGMDLNNIAAVSGHRDIKQLQKYIKASQSETAEVISGNKFFARQPYHLKVVPRG